MPNALDLLYKAATGSFPTSGQGLKAALGALSGDDALDWLVSAWAFSGTVPNPTTTYSDGQVFGMNIAFTQGAWAGGGSGRTAIKRTGNVVLLEELTGGSGVGDSTVTSSIVAAATGSTVSVTARAPWRSNQTITDVDVWFSEWDEPNMPNDNLEHEVRFSPIISIGSSTVVDCSFKLAYVVDNGPWNPDLEEVFEYKMNSRQASIFDWEWEWHNNSSYTDLYSTQTELFETGSLPSTVWTFYLRGRRAGTATWDNFGAVTWTDPR